MFYFVFALGILLDILSKWTAQNYLSEQIPLLWDFVFLKYAENPGIAFSIELPPVLLKVLTIVLIIAIFYYYKQEKKSLSKKNDRYMHDIAFALILSGAVGNGIERIFHEKVIDFLWVQWFAIFNLADTWITLGAILYFYMIFVSKKINF